MVSTEQKFSLFTLSAQYVHKFIVSSLEKYTLKVAGLIQFSYPSHHASTTVTSYLEQGKW